MKANPVLDGGGIYVVGDSMVVLGETRKRRNVAFTIGIWYGAFYGAERQTSHERILCQRDLSVQPVCIIPFRSSNLFLALASVLHADIHAISKSPH